MQADLQQAFEFAEKQFNGELGVLDGKLSSIEEEIPALERNARILKGISVFGGLIITSGFLSGVPLGDQVIGVAISAAVAYDGWSSNHKKLMGRSLAVGQLDSLRRSIETQHTDAMQDFLNTGKSDESRRSLIAVLRSLRGEVASEISRIESQTREVDRLGYRAWDLGKGDSAGTD